MHTQINLNVVIVINFLGTFNSAMAGHGYIQSFNWSVLVGQLDIHNMATATLRKLLGTWKKHKYVIITRRFSICLEYQGL